MSRLSLDNATKVATDAAYVGIGLGVLAFQRAQVQRQDLRKSTSSQLEDARQTVRDAASRVDDRVRVVEERLQALEDQLETSISQLESRLPEPLAEASRAARAGAKAMRTQVRDLTRR